MKFKNADDVRNVVEMMRQTDQTAHSQNRARVNELFEGFPPFSDEEAEENHLDTNISFLEPSGIAHKARGTWNNAFLKPGNYFSGKIDSGPVHKRSKWNAAFTQQINQAMKNGKSALRYIETIRGTGAQVILHGIGPVRWVKAKSWCPKEIGIEDLLVPSATKVNLENLPHFAIYEQWTPEELYRMIHGKQVDPGWNMKIVYKELKRVTSELTKSQDAYQDLNNPEKIIKFYKMNSGFLDTDAVPTVNAWNFFYQEDNDEEGKWYRKIILEDSSYEGADFLYASKRPYSSCLSQILHIQFGDGANVAPFLYHCVRSLGFLLYGICHLQNRLRCRTMDAIFEATLQYFRSSNADDRARIQKVDLFHLGLVPNGLQFVPAAERWKLDPNVVEFGLSQNRQLMSEHASTFVQDVDDGTQKELTATEVMARLNSANALVSSLLSMAYTYQKFQYQEIARRFFLRDTNDPDIIAFRLGCLKAGIPEEYLNIERWQIEPDRVMGGGNKTLELAQAKGLLEVIDRMDPNAQQMTLRDYALAVSDDAAKAVALFPEDTQSLPPAAHDAQLAVGALMNGAPVAVRQGMDHVSYVTAMIASMQYIVEDIKHVGQPMPIQVIGLVNCYKHIQGHLQIIAQNKQNQQLVRQLQDALKPIMNDVKAWGQQLDEARESAAQQNGDGGKMAAAVITAQSKAKIAEASASMKEKRKDVAFVKEQKRRDVQTMTEAQRQKLLTGAQVASMDAKTAADIRKKRLSSFSE